MNHPSIRKLIAFGTPLLLATFAGSCSDDFENRRHGLGDSRDAVILHADISQVATTRADESGFADGDRMGVFAVSYNNDVPGSLANTGNHADNVAFTLDADNGSWKAASDIYWVDKQTPADFYAYYPFVNVVTSVEAYPFEVAADQNRQARDGELSAYEASDFLLAVATNAQPGKRVDLTFKHRLAGVKVTLEPGAGISDSEWTKLPKIVTVDNTLRQAEINISSGKATPVGDYDLDIIMNPQGEESSAYRAIVVPQTVAAGKSTIGITIDGVSYVYKRDGGMTYTPGKLHSFKIKIDKKEDGSGYALSLTGQAITDWEADRTSHDFEANSYLVIDCPTPGQLKDKIRESGADFSTLKNLKVTGTIDWTDFKFIKEELSQLASLNIKEVRCVNAVISYENGNPMPEYGVADDYIPAYALNDKETLRRIILPETITHIGAHAFGHLRLTSTLIIPESVTVIEEWALEGIGEEATIILPNNLEKIGGCVFYGTSATMELKLPQTLKFLGGAAFWDTPNVYGTFSLPSGLEYLGESAFRNCGNGLIGDIIIPYNITEVPREAFSGMKFERGTSLILHEGITKIGENAFRGLKFNSTVKLPKNLREIGESAFEDCHFSGSVIIPENIAYLGHHAFAFTNFQGELKYPASLDYVLGGGDYICYGGAFCGTKISSLVLDNNIQAIGEAAFEGCEDLRNVLISKNVDFIGTRAFNGCDQIQTIVCLANEPPKIDENVFSVFFDKCILEVPEKSIEIYRNTPIWNQFKNITPHRELAFNIPDIACLNGGVTRMGILRSEGPWKISECPSWVHVSPTSGEYKEEITVMVDAQNADSPSREGKIVFSLNGKDYTTYTTVRQLSYEHPENKEIVLQTASASGSEIPVFIVGEGFTADQISNGEYMNRMNETMEQFFDIEPYRTLRNYFTVTTAIACSPDEGTVDASSLKQNCFETNGVEPNYWKLREYTEQVSQHAGKNLSNALIIMVTNINAFSGWSNIDYDGCAIASVGIIDEVYPYDQRGLVQHYAGGRAFAGLGEETITHFEHIKGCSCPYCNKLNEFREMKQRGFLENLSLSAKMNDAPWRDFIFHEKYSQYVDMWEGGYNHLRGVWRSEANSIMNTYIRYFNAISRYTIYKAAMKRAGRNASFEEFVNIDKFETPEQ